MASVTQVFEPLFTTLSGFGIGSRAAMIKSCTPTWAGDEASGGVTHNATMPQAHFKTINLTPSPRPELQCQGTETPGNSRTPQVRTSGTDEPQVLAYI